MNILKFFAVCTGATALALGGTVPAQAGEYDGRGGPVPGGSTGSSLCAYSGQDLPDDQENQPNRPDDFVTEAKVQNYGQYVNAGMKDLVPSPGVLCRGNLGAH